MTLEKCPLCSATVKQENLREHYARVHPKRLGTLTRSQTLQAPRRPHGRSHRKILLALLVVVLLTGVTAYALRRGGQSEGEPPSLSAAPLTVAASPSTVPIAGTGIVAFDVTLTPQESLSSDIVLSLLNRPAWVRAIFDPARLTLSQNPGSSRVTLVVEQGFEARTYTMRVVASVGSAVAETAVSLQISDPFPSKHFYLKANSSGWNSTEASGPNPAIQVLKGETFTLTALSAQNDPDAHHYISIYPSGTPESQVYDYSTGYYVRSGFEWSHSYPATETITFTSWIAGTLEYYCDSHSSTMHGTITVTA